ncbi:MAG: type II toxin-antitoxin system HicA family toxin [Anaerolineaceae bacterium]|nr:type II toxin-antitoxin system HicA family toxin [Anaerolineaceae bacterium]
MDDLYGKIKRNTKNTNPKELIKLLESYGFVYRRTTGGHDIYKRPGFRSFPVPTHVKRLAPFIIRNALHLIDEIRELEE